MNKLRIKNIPEADRPYEKLEKIGAQALSTSELLAIIIKTGTKKESSLDIAKILLSKKKNGLKGIEYIEWASISELMTYSGIGRVKAIELKACIEIAKRYSIKEEKTVKIISPKNVYDLLSYEMQNLEVEEIKIVILNTKAYVKSVVTISKGALNSTCITMKEILIEPIKQMAAAIILVHNHPSGDTNPSKADIILTEKVISSSIPFDIEIKDHVIIGKTGYTSIRELHPEIFIKGRKI